MNNTTDTSGLGVVLEVLSFAVAVHGTQRRKGGKGEPYVAHLIEVARLLWQTGEVRDTDIIIAGILHDTVEDTTVTEEMLREQFGSRVAAIVMEVTDDKSLSTTKRRRLQVAHASSLSPAARLIKLADKLSNVTDILDSPPVGWSLSERLRYVNWSRDVINCIRGANEALEQAFDDRYHRAVEELAGPDLE